jgi:hypothetical protein
MLFRVFSTAIIHLAFWDFSICPKMSMATARAKENFENILLDGLVLWKSTLDGGRLDWQG